MERMASYKKLHVSSKTLDGHFGDYFLGGKKTTNEMDWADINTKYRHINELGNNCCLWNTISTFETM